jgi:glycosyltransferase involved in cell wall biosynthesis
VQLVSVVVPVHNESMHVADMAGEFTTALGTLGTPFELLLVPNNCRDNTVEICQALSQANAAVRVVASELGGWGRAVRLGLAHARGDTVCYTNGARTSAADLLAVLTTARDNPRAVVKATRIEREHWTRRFGSALYNLECRLLLGSAFRDVNGTPKVFPRAYTPLLQVTRDDDLIDAEFCRIVAVQGYPRIEVPVKGTARRSGRSTTNYRSALKMYRGALQMAWTSRVSGGAS